MHAEGYFLVKNDFNIPHSATGGQGDAIQSKIFKAEYNNLNYIWI